VFGWSGAALVARDGRVLLEKGYGLADRASGRANGPDTTFEIASATKPITALAVLRLEEAGKLSLDDPIEKHLEGVPADKRGITIRHLLSHASGMPRSAAGGRGSDLARATADYLAPAAVRAPGEAFEYWNGGYALLAGIVERASGRPYVDVCRDEVFVRAGLLRTGFTGDATLPDQAVGYDGDTAVRPAAGHPYGGAYGWQYRGMGGVVTSVRDVHRLVTAYEAGRIVSSATRKRMETAVVRHQALGWGVSETARKTRRVGHGGSVRGFHAEVQSFPDERAVVIVLSNVEGVPLWTIAWNLEALLFGDAPRYPMPPTVAASPAGALDALCGTYDLAGGDRVVVERAGDGLRVSAKGAGAVRRLGTDSGSRAARSRVYLPVSEGGFAAFAWIGPQPPRIAFERAEGEDPRLRVGEGAGATVLSRAPAGAAPAR
jgi:CubicO group peptidase (beta-lactamase class C family)